MSWRRLGVQAHDLPAELRNAQRGFALANQTESANWVAQELNGYPSGNDVPGYRTIHGEEAWGPAGDTDLAPHVASKMRRSAPPPEAAVWRCDRPITDVLSWASAGLFARTAETRERMGGYGKSYEVRGQRYDGPQFSRVVNAVRRGSSNLRSLGTD